MVLYRCEKCGFEVNDKSRYKRHLNRKFPCNGIIFSGDKCDVEVKVPPKTSLMPIIDGKKKYTCETCNKVFTRKDNLLRHVKLRCKDNIEMRLKKLESNIPVIYQTINTVYFKDNKNR